MFKKDDILRRPRLTHVLEQVKGKESNVVSLSSLKKVVLGGLNKGESDIRQNFLN